MYRFRFRRGGWALGVYLFAHPRFHRYIYMLCCPRCFALLAHVAFLFAAYLPSDPSLASSQPTRAGAYTVGDLSATVMAGYPLCVSDGVWFFGGVCFRLRAIFIFGVVVVVVGGGCASLECGSTCLVRPPCVDSTAGNQVRAR